MTMLDRIEVVEKIGQGGMAIVYRGYLHGNYGFKKEIVVKKILKEHFDNNRYLDMFVDEASISAKLNHSNIVQVFDFFEENNELHILMEFVNGGTLRDLMIVNKEGELFIPIEHVLFIINNLLTGMDFYHNKRDVNGKHLGIIHRDLTPKNVLLSIYGEVKISDFGIAKFEDKKDLTTFGEVKGKPSYMSPEQIKLLPNLDNRVDLFSLGVMFYELLTNKHPFREANVYQTQQNIMNENYAPISDFRDDLSPEVEKIVYKLLKVDRDKRYLSAGLVKKDLLNLKEKISTQLVFSRYATEMLQPGYVNYIQSILPDVHSRSDYRMIERKEKKKGLFRKRSHFLYGIAALLFFNIVLFVFTLSKNSKVNKKLAEIESRGAVEIKPVVQKEDIVSDDNKEKGGHSAGADSNIRPAATVTDSEKTQKTEMQKTETQGIASQQASHDDKKENIKKEANKTPRQPKADTPLKEGNKKKKKIYKPRKAILDIYVIPFGDIYLDGKKISSVTRLGYKVRPGKHKLEIKDSSGKSRGIKMINIRAGEKKEFRFKLN